MHKRALGQQEKSGGMERESSLSLIYVDIDASVCTVLKASGTLKSVVLSDLDVFLGVAVVTTGRTALRRDALF